MVEGLHESRHVDGRCALLANPKLAVLVAAHSVQVALVWMDKRDSLLVISAAWSSPQLTERIAVWKQTSLGKV